MRSWRAVTQTRLDALQQLGRCVRLMINHRQAHGMNSWREFIASRLAARALVPRVLEHRVCRRLSALWVVWRGAARKRRIAASKVWHTQQKRRYALSAALSQWRVVMWQAIKRTAERDHLLVHDARMSLGTTNSGDVSARLVRGLATTREGIAAYLAEAEQHSSPVAAQGTGYRVQRSSPVAASMDLHTPDAPPTAAAAMRAEMHAEGSGSRSTTSPWEGWWEAGGLSAEKARAFKLAEEWAAHEATTDYSQLVAALAQVAPSPVAPTPLPPPVQTPEWRMDQRMSELRQQQQLLHKLMLREDAEQAYHAQLQAQRHKAVCR